MKSHKTRILVLIAVVAVAALVWFGRHRIHFNWGVFVEQLRQADWGRMAVALACIYFGYVIRSVRWAMLMRHAKKVPPFSLIGTQVIGFTAVALIGRVADLVRPYLVSKKTLQPLGSQIAVYIVERLFDAGAMALIVSAALLWVPQDEILRVASRSGLLAHLAMHHRVFVVVLERFGGLIITVAGAAILVWLRFTGEGIVRSFETVFGLISPKVGRAVAEKVRTFHSGLDTIRSLSDFVIAAALSVGMWLLIAAAYLEGTRAFTASPALAGISIPKCALLMLASGGASMIQLPVIGWFSQIAIVAGLLGAMFGASPEAAMACAAALLLVTSLAIAPVGLIWARFEHVSLKKVAEESEHAGEELAHHAPEPVRSEVG